LAEGEEIIWHQMKTEGIRHKKVVWIEALTNYRVFYYDYKPHAGIMVLLPALEDVVVNNQRRASNTDSVGFYSGSYRSLSGFRNTKGTSRTIGDVVLIAEGKPYIIFGQVADPHGLASVIKSMKKQQSHIRIGRRIQTENIGEEQSKVNQPDNRIQITQTKTMTPSSNNVVNVINCNKCGNNNNLKGSKFCNKCGFKLQNNCSNCGNINPENSAFCNQCGFALS
jgi:Double zinc ribbon